MPNLKTSAALVLLGLALLMQPAWAQDDLMTSELVDQAHEWQQKNRDDLAAEVWRKLLRFNPNHAEALVQLAQIELRANHLSEAELLYRHASRLTPPPRGLSQLAAALQAAKEPTKPPPPPPPAPAVPAPTKEAAKEPVPVAKPVERNETRPPRRPPVSTPTPSTPSNDNQNNNTPTQGIILKLSPSLGHTPKRP